MIFRRLIKSVPHNTALINLIKSPEQIASQTRWGLKFMACGMMLLSAIYFLYADNLISVLTAATIGAVCLICLWVISEDTAGIVANIVLWTMTVAIAFTAWTDYGLYDGAMFAFPCILLIAAIVSGLFNFIVLLLFMASSVVFFVYIHQLGMFPDIQPKDVTERAYFLIWLFAIFALILWSLFHNFKQAYFKLTGENQFVHNKIEKLQQNSRVDMLTGLPNEFECERRVNQLLESSSFDKKLALIILDLKNFKSINSSFGYDVGDEILCQVCERFKLVAGKDGELFRVNGSEFILIFEFDSYDDTADLAAQCVKATSRIFSLISYEILVKVVAGIACSPIDGERYKVLKKKAHIALSSALSENDTEFLFYDEQMELDILQRYEMIIGIKQALENNEFELHYQPKIDLLSGRIIGAEALIRWNKPNHGYIYPDEFIPVAEGTNLINKIGFWVLHQACNECQYWHELGMTELSVAVNLSPVQFYKGDLSTTVLAALQNARLDGRFLELEITESMMLNNDAELSEQIEDIQSYGVGFSIDDFGTGYSNLSYLSQFKAHALKIDKSFVQNMYKSVKDKHIAKAVIDLGTALSLNIIAEGVEDQSTADELTRLGCNTGQGYLWAKALPSNEFVKFCMKQQKLEDSIKMQDVISG